MTSPPPWGVDNSDPQFVMIRDCDGEVVCGGTFAIPMGSEDAALIVRAVNAYSKRDIPGPEDIQVIAGDDLEKGQDVSIGEDRKAYPFVNQYLDPNLADAIVNGTNRNTLAQESLTKAIETLGGPLEVLSVSGKPVRLFDEHLNEVLPEDPRWEHYRSIVNTGYITQ